MLEMGEQSQILEVELLPGEYNTHCTMETRNDLYIKIPGLDIVSMRMQVQSLASISGLRIWHCHKLHQRLQLQLRSGVTMTVALAYILAPIQALAWEFHKLQVWP